MMNSQRFIENLMALQTKLAETDELRGKLRESMFECPAETGYMLMLQLLEGVGFPDDLKPIEEYFLRVLPELARGALDAVREQRAKLNQTLQ
jgi:hypothetical protein